MYREALVDRCACWNRYEVSDRYALNGERSLFSVSERLIRLEQNTLLALANSYVESKTPISGPGLVRTVSSSWDDQQRRYVQSSK